MSKYGKAPILIDNIVLEPSEMCFVQYLPIRMSYNDNLGCDVRIPPNLEWTRPLVHKVIRNHDLDHYIYLTVKHLYVEPNSMGNRPGWHSDGFKTDDINYIWVDSFPTEFCIQDFDLSDDCEQSMLDMETQVKKDNITTYKSYDLLLLDQYVIHRTPKGTGFRTFVKISVSKDRYNLKGNAHNYLFDYSWKMVERKTTRNHPNQ